MYISSPHGLVRLSPWSELFVFVYIKKKQGNSGAQVKFKSAVVLPSAGLACYDNGLPAIGAKVPWM